MKRIVFAALTSVAVGLFGTALAAQSLQEGIEAWLADDDPTALPILSALANEGNREAQFVLGQIERVTPPGADSAFVQGLARRDRIALLRAQEGLSGRSWTVVRQRDGDPLADALMVSRLPDAGIETAQFLFEQGEREAAARLAFEIFDRGNFGEILSLPSSDPLLQDLDFVSWMRSYFGSPPGPNQWAWLGQTPTQGRPSGLMMVFFVAPVLAPHLRPGQDLRHFTQAMRGAPNELLEAAQLPQAAGILREQMQTDPVLATVKTLCDQNCPDQVGYCALSVITRVQGYDRLQFLDSPFESVIPQEQFATSPRAVNSLIRWMVASEERGLLSDQVISQCVRQLVAEAKPAADAG